MSLLPGDPAPIPGALLTGGAKGFANPGRVVFRALFFSRSQTSAAGLSTGYRIGLLEMADVTPIQIPDEDLAATPSKANRTSRKPRPNHQRSLQILRAMTPQEKLAQVFKLNERTLRLFRIGLRRRFPDLNDETFHSLYLRMRERCHNRNY